MNISEQLFWANSLNVGKYKYNLLNVIFSEAVGHEVDKLRKKVLWLERRHECLMPETVCTGQNTLYRVLSACL